MQGAAERSGWGKWVLVSIGIALAAGLITLLVEYWVVQPKSAQQAESWTTNLTPADSGGVTASGEVQRAENGLIHLTGTLLDNKKDGKATILIIWVDHHGSREKDEERREYVAGVNRSKEIGHSFPGNIEAISVRECLTTRRDARKGCGSDSESVQIWSADRSWWQQLTDW
ncbi:hypothetical protein [Parasphingorhabdus pacifica]